MGFDTEMHHVQMIAQDLHQIAKSFLITCSQYSKLEKELEKEFKLGYGWFKPKRLNQVTGEAVRDKQMREAIERKNVKKAQKIEQNVAQATERKQVTKRNSSMVNNDDKKNKG